MQAEGTVNIRTTRAEAELRKLDRHKRIERTTGRPLGPEMISFFKQSVAKRHTQLGKIAEVWGRLIPETLLEHCALEGYTRGSLTVLVDSSSHLYELKQLLLAGLQQQLLLACRPAGLRKINLKAGRWYDSVDDGVDRKLRFDR
jgi:Dna[CI] antecedent, DciA